MTDLASQPCPNLLMEQVLAGANLERAWNNVRRNGGAPGPDGVTIAEFPDYCDRHWPRIRQQLLEGTYQPSPARRKSIPKPDGGQRDLGIPNVMDRVSRKISDRRLLQLIGRYLRAGVMVDAQLQPSIEGTMQGGPLSPLLANIPATSAPAVPRVLRGAVAAGATGGDPGGPLAPSGVSGILGLSVSDSRRTDSSFARRPAQRLPTRRPAFS